MNRNATTVRLARLAAVLGFVALLAAIPAWAASNTTTLPNASTITSRSGLVDRRRERLDQVAGGSLDAPEGFPHCAVEAVEVGDGADRYAVAHVACRTFTRSKVVRFDGPQSVANAYTVEEVRELCRLAGLIGALVRRSWPWRMTIVHNKPESPSLEGRG